MKLLSKIQLIALAFEVFKQNLDQETCYAREDGNIFFEENYADLGRGQMKVYKLSKSIVEGTKADNGKVADAATPKPATEYKKEVISANKNKDKPSQSPAPDETPKAEPTVEATLGKEGKNPEDKKLNIVK